MRINLIFYILLLELIPQNVLIIILNLSKKNEIIEYEVLDIIKQAIKKDD